MESWKKKKSWSWKKIIFSPKVKRVTYLGSNGASDSGFIESLHRDLNTRNASFCVMWENLTAPPPWLLREVDDALPSTSAPDSLWVSPSSSDIGDDVSVGVEGTWRSYCGSPLMFGFSGLLSFTSPFARLLWSNDKTEKHAANDQTMKMKKEWVVETKLPMKYPHWNYCYRQILLLLKYGADLYSFSKESGFPFQGFLLSFTIPEGLSALICSSLLGSLA